MNSITAHATCTIIWILIGSVLGIVIGMYRTLDKIGWMQWVGLVSLMAALITAAATAGIQDPPADIQVQAVRNPGFLPGVQAGTNIILAFTGGPAFYNVLSEMKRPREFNKAVYWAQGFVTMTYLIIAAVIYGFVGACVHHSLSKADEAVRSPVPLSAPSVPSCSGSATALFSPVSSSGPSSTSTSRPNTVGRLMVGVVVASDHRSLCAGASRHPASDRKHLAALDRLDVSQVSHERR